MTRRLYYTDSLLRSFDATVVSSEAHGDHHVVVLDETAFYPSSGGQPFDTGRLGHARVIDVTDGDDGLVRHVVDGPLPVGARVHGEIDWPRRFDHMQQHTGQHILSAAFTGVVGVQTVSFHLGTEASTIDLAREVTPREIALVEEEANRVVWENHPVTVRFASEADASRLPLRKESARTGELRLVEVAGCDLSACGGTHVTGTGAVGLIAVTGWERFKGATRVSFACGGRALRSHGALRDIVTAVTRALSLGAAEIPGAIERWQGEVKDLQRTVRRLEEELAAFRAAGLREGAETIGRYRGVLLARPGSDAAALKTLAAALVSEPGLVVVLTGDGHPVPVVVARSADVDLDAGAWMKRATSVLGGRGGGRPELAQGGLTASSADVLVFARQALK